MIENEIQSVCLPPSSNVIIEPPVITEPPVIIDPPVKIEPPITRAPELEGDNEHVSRLPELEDDDHVSRESGDVLNIFARTSHFLKWINSEMVNV